MKEKAAARNYDKHLTSPESVPESRERLAPDPAWKLSPQMRRLKAGEPILEGNKATQAQPLFM